MFHGMAFNRLDQLRDGLREADEILAEWKEETGGDLPAWAMWVKMGLHQVDKEWYERVQAEGQPTLPGVYEAGLEDLPY